MAEYVQLICPLCGTAHGERAKVRIKVRSRSGRTYTLPGETENYWERLSREWREEKLLGVIQGTGRGGLKDVEKVDITDPRLQEYVEPMLEILKRVVKLFVKRGFLSLEELTP